VGDQVKVMGAVVMDQKSSRAHLNWKCSSDGRNKSDGRHLVECE